MSAGAPVSFKIEEEAAECVKHLASSQNVVTLCIVAPFAPLRVAPKTSIIAQFSFPDEFVIEEFMEKIAEKYPTVDNRPPLYLLIHSPGGTVSSSYVVARVLRDSFKRIVGFVPHIAASGATLIALCCNEVVMGNISRLTGIDPHYRSGGETIHPLSIVRAFDNLEKILGTKTMDEISYPYQHLVQSITAEKYDEATHSLNLVEGYAAELMKKAGYDDKQTEQVLNALLYNVEAHEEVFLFERAKEIGMKAHLFSEVPAHHEAWKAMKEWLRSYYMKPSPVHIIRYCLPSGKGPGVNDLKKQGSKKQ